MKNLFTIIILFVLINGTAMGQGFVQPQEYQPYIKPYVPNTANDDYRNKINELNSLYDRNLALKNQLEDWTLELKNQNIDDQFRNALSNNYDKLRAMDREGDFENMGTRLNNIKQEIKYEIDSYNTRVKEKPKELWKKANEYLTNGEYQEAINSYDELAILSPDFIYLHRNRGISYAMLKKNVIALTDLDRFIDKVKDDAYAYRTRGWVNYHLKDFNNALSDFKMQIELKPNADAYYNSGSAKSKLNDQVGAISDYTKAIEINPKYSMAYNNRGWAKFEMKLYNEALKDLNKAIELDSNNWVAFDSRQETKFALNDFKGCMDDCNIGISLNPELANSYLFRGRVYFKQGNKVKACEDWGKAGELGKSEAYEFIKKYCNQ